jgi:hypothetical protein
MQRAWISKYVCQVFPKKRFGQKAFKATWFDGRPKIAKCTASHVETYTL